MQLPGSIEGPVEVSIAASKPDGRKRDLDNVAGKAVLDLLVAHGIIADDSMMVRFVARWDDTIPGGRISIMLKCAASGSTFGDRDEKADELVPLSRMF